jgi:hypothetical protein
LTPLRSAIWPMGKNTLAVVVGLDIDDETTACPKGKVKCFLGAFLHFASDFASWSGWLHGWRISFLQRPRRC